MSILSERLKLVKPSATLSITQKAIELKARGVNIISLAAGEPDFDTPNNIKNAAIEGINKGYTKYTNVDGMLELKIAVREKFKRENNLEYNLDEIIVGTGGKQVIYNLFMASLNDGDEVIIPAPYWVSYPDIVLLASGTPVVINCTIEDKFKLTPTKLAKAITPQTKWLIINSPSNPAGSAYSLQDLESLAEILRAHPNIYVLSDDIYEHIVFDGFKFSNLAQVADDLKDRVFIVNGVSKSYSMTGWRIGYGAGAKSLIKAMTMIQSQSTSNPCSISQVAAIEALNGSQYFIEENTKNFEQKRDLALSILKDIKGLEYYKPEGAFYLFIKCSQLFGHITPHGETINTSEDLVKYLLEYSNVATVPGSAFGLEGYFRISYALSTEQLQQACLNIKNACSQLTN